MPFFCSAALLRSAAPVHLKWTGSLFLLETGAKLTTTGPLEIKNALQHIDKKLKGVRLAGGIGSPGLAFDLNSNELPNISLFPTTLIIWALSASVLHSKYAPWAPTI